jgi:IS30 family transposase
MPTQQVGRLNEEASASWGSRHPQAYERARRPKTPKLVAGPLCTKVESWLEKWWSPEEIARRMRLEHAEDPTMWVSHETIYQSLFVQGRGELRRELHSCLRTGRAQRRPKGKVETRGKIPNMVMISEATPCTRQAAAPRAHRRSRSGAPPRTPPCPSCRWTAT